MTEQNQNNLKYARRNWHKGSMYFLGSEKFFYAKDKFLLKVWLYINDRKLYLECFNPKVIEEINKINPQEKVKFWFSAESTEHNKRWYTRLILKHIECLRLIELEKSKTEVSSGNAFNFGQGADEF